jgi:PIN domain nuclease of toxin-antitoxin system
VRVLLDTHALLWFASNDPRLGARAREVISDPATERLVSIASAWELAIKSSIGKLTTVGPFADWLDSLCAGAAVELLPVAIGDVRRLHALPWHHRDPFDRMLVAQASERGIAIVTADADIGRYDVEVIW